MGHRITNCFTCKTDFVPITFGQRHCCSCREAGKIQCLLCNASPKYGESSYCKPCAVIKRRQANAARVATGVCKICTITLQSLEYQHCLKCRAAKSLVGAERYINMKRRAIEYLGGCCVDCCLKTDRFEVYDFHHINPDEKEQGINRLTQSAWDKIVVELDKCVLLCTNCHRMRERNIDVGVIVARCNEAGMPVPTYLQ